MPPFAVGVGITIMLTVDVTAGHGSIPVVASVNIAVPVNIAGGVQVAINVFEFGINIPPESVVQMPPVAAPPTVPDNVTVPP